MTISKQDTAPATWFRCQTDNTNLPAICKWLDENKIEAEFSGAVTMGIMEALFGPSPLVVAFEHEEDHRAFAKFLQEGDLSCDDAFIFVPTQAPRGSRVETLPQ